MNIRLRDILRSAKIASMQPFHRSLLPVALMLAVFNVTAADVPELPKSVDLRPEFQRFELAPRRQLSRPTCSVFTIAGALEFAVAKRQGNSPRLSVEFLNWSGNQLHRAKEDGGFFSDLWKGFEAHGICTEQDLPYQGKFDAGAASERHGDRRCKNQAGIRAAAQLDQRVEREHGLNRRALG